MMLYGITIVDSEGRTCYLLYADEQEACEIYRGQVLDALNLQDTIPHSCGRKIYDTLVDKFRPIEDDDIEDYFYAHKAMMIGGTISLRSWQFEVDPDPVTRKAYALEIYHKFGGTDELFVFDDKKSRDEKVLAYCQGFQRFDGILMDASGASVREALDNEELPGKIIANEGIDEIEIVVGTFTFDT